MAVNPFSSIFGIEEEDEEEEVITPAEEPEYTNPFDAIFAGDTAEVPVEEEPEVVPPVEEEVPVREEPSWFDRAVAPTASGIPAETGAGMGDFVRGLGEKAIAAKEMTISGLQESVTDPYRKNFARLVGADPEAVGISIGTANLTESAEARRAKGEEAEKRAAKLAPENKAAKFVYDLAGATIEMAPSVALSYITRKPDVALVTMGAQVYGRAYAQARSEGKTPDEAKADAIVAFATELAPEKAFGVFTNLAFGKGGKTLVQQMLSEAPSEGLTSILQLADDMGRQGEYVGPQEAVSRVLYDTALGAGMGLSMAAPRAIAQPFLDARQERKTLEAMVPNLPEELAQAEALESLRPDRAQAYITAPDGTKMEPITLPPVDIDLGPQSTQQQTIDFRGNLTVQEGTALGRVKELAADPSRLLAEPTSTDLPPITSRPIEPTPVEPTPVEPVTVAEDTLPAVEDTLAPVEEAAPATQEPTYGDLFDRAKWLSDAVEADPSPENQAALAQAMADLTAAQAERTKARETPPAEAAKPAKLPAGVSLQVDPETEYAARTVVLLDGETVGGIEARIIGGTTAQIKSSVVDENMRGQGIGTELYKKFIDDQHRRGREVQSDYSVTKSALRAWEKLKEQGYNIEIAELQEVYDDDGSFKYYEATDGGPVVRVKPKGSAKAGTTTVKRGPDFQFDGTYIVTLPDGTETKISKDAGGTGWWYEIGAEDKTGRNYGSDMLGFTKKEAIAALEKRQAETANKPAQPEKVTPEPAAKEEDAVGQDGRLASMRTKLEQLRALPEDASHDGSDAQREAARKIDRIMGSDWAYTGADWQSLTHKERAIAVQQQSIKNRTRYLSKKVTPPKAEKAPAPKKMAPKKKVAAKKPKPVAKPARDKGEAIVSEQPVTTPDVGQALTKAKEVTRLTGKAPDAPVGPLAQPERISMRENARKEIEVNSIMSALASVAGTGNIDLETAGLTVEKKGTGFVVRSETGTDQTLTSQDVQNLRYADLGSFRKAGLANYLRLKIDTANVGWRGKKHPFNFRRTKTSQMFRDQATEVLRTINAARVGIHTKLEILNTQWEAEHDTQVQDAPTEQLEAINAHLTNNMSMDELQRQVELTPEMVRNLTLLRKDIDILSGIMKAEGMIDNELAFQIDKNMGSYLRIQYALKDVEARGENLDKLLKLIPEEKMNRVAQALMDAYLEPAYRGELHKLPRATLKRLARTYGLVASNVVGGEVRTDEEGNVIPTPESSVIAGTKIDLDRDKASVIAAALQQKLAEKATLPEDVVLRFLQGDIGGARASMHGREKSAERARDLSRTEEELRADGYTEEEIALTVAFRAMLAEHLDPVTTIQQTANTMLNHIASHRIVNSVMQLAPTGAVSIGTANRRTGAVKRLVEEGDKWADVRVVDPATGESRPASQIFVRPEIRLQFDRLVRPNFADGLLTDVYRTAQAITKINLTALNAGSHFRNIRSSLEIAATRGYLLSPNLQRTMKALHAASSMAAHNIGVVDQKWTDEALDAAAMYLTKLGILHDSVRTGPIKELLIRMHSSKDVSEAFEGSTYLTASGNTLEDALHKFGKSRGVRQTRQKLLETPLGAYRLEDEGPKILAFLQEREMVADMMDRDDLVEVMQGKRRPTRGEREEIKKIDLKASKKIRNLFPTYSSVPEFVKDLSANLFATPFPSFNAEMIRNWAHDIRDVSDMAAFVIRKEKTGYYAGMNREKVAARLGGRLMSWSAMGAYYSTILSSIGLAFGWMGSLPFGAEPDDEDEVTKNARALVERMAEHGYTPGIGELDALDPFFRSLLPGWGKSNLYQIVKFEHGKSITVMDMSYTMPYSQLTQLGVNLGGAAGSLLEGNLNDAAEAASGGILRFAGEWTAMEPLADAMLQLATGTSQFGELEGWERTDALIKMITPGSQTLKSLQRLVAPADDPHAQDLADFVRGQRPFTLHLDKSYVNAIWPEKLMLRDASVKIRDLVREAAEGDIQEKEFRTRYRDYEEQRQRAMAQIEFINYSADILGLSKYARRKIISESTLTGDNRITKPGLADGKWLPTYLVPGDIYKENARADIKTTREYSRWLRVMRDVQQENDWR